MRTPILSTPTNHDDWHSYFYSWTSIDDYYAHLKSYAHELSWKWVPNPFKSDLRSQAYSAMHQYLYDYYSHEEFTAMHRNIHPELYI